MLLIRDAGTKATARRALQDHTTVLHEVHTGTADLEAVYRRRLASVLRDAAGSALYADRLPHDLATALEHLDEGRSVASVLADLPLLPKSTVSEHGSSGFCRPMADFLHYYESSGTTGNPLPAPKAIDDLVANTVNIGEMWGRVLTRDDIALILINAPFAPAAYQFEKVLEYLEVMSMRPWVDNITGDYTRILRLVDELDATVFVGPPSRLLEMVQFAHRTGLPLPRFRTLLLMAEQTGPAFQRHLERLTGGTAYVGTYGSSETGTTAITCEARALHLQLQSFLLELHTDAGTRLVTQDGTGTDRGELVVTTLDLSARPLLRYRTGDLVEVDHTPCACGLHLPVLRTQGRAQDVLLLDEHGLRQNDLEDALWGEPLPDSTVFNYMLVVRESSAVLLVTTTGAPDGPWTDVLADRLGPVLGAMRVVVRPVDTLPPLASLGQYLGWKLSRVLDLGDEANWSRLPEPILGIVRETLEAVR